MTIDTTPKATYPAYTNLALGEGLFDQLMLAVEKQLDKQYDAQRIRGTDYANVLVGSINSVLGNTTQYLLGQLLVEEQRAKIVAETNLLLKGEDKIDVEIELLGLEKAKLKYEIEEILPLQKSKLQTEIDVLNAQILKITEEITQMQAQQALWVKQGLKIDKEVVFLSTKIRTEDANTVGGVAQMGSLINDQQRLLRAQKLGFSGDLQVKVGKLHADYDAVYQSVQESTSPGSASLGTNAQQAADSAESTAAFIASV